MHGAVIARSDKLTMVSRTPWSRLRVSRFGVIARIGPPFRMLTRATARFFENYTERHRAWGTLAFLSFENRRSRYPDAARKRPRLAKGRARATRRERDSPRFMPLRVMSASPRS